MLVLTRMKGQSILIGQDIEVLVDRISKGQTRIAVRAPREILILRGELSKKDKQTDGQHGDGI